MLELLALLVALAGDHHDVAPLRLGDGAPDRAAAVGVAIGEPGDVVVIAGKGHEQGQEFENGRKEPFDDVTVARDALRARRRVRA